MLPSMVDRTAKSRFMYPQSEIRRFCIIRKCHGILILEVSVSFPQDGYTVAVGNRENHSKENCVNSFMDFIHIDNKGLF